MHPNYGSHIAAIFPENATAARILLEGIVAAYDGFFALSWSELPLTGLCAALLNAFRLMPGENGFQPRALLLPSKALSVQIPVGSNVRAGALHLDPLPSPGNLPADLGRMRVRDHALAPTLFCP